MKSLLAAVAAAALHAPPGPVPAPDPEPATDSAPTTSASPGDCVFIPIKGAIGKDALAAGVRDALDRTRRRGTTEVVFEIDSESGSFAEAAAIVNAMAEFDASLRYHAVIRRAIGPAMWITPFCDTVWIPTGEAPPGVALAFARSADTMPTDFPSPSALAAEACASRHTGPDRCSVYRAMLVPGAELHRVVEHGEPRLEATPGGPGTFSEPIDGPKTLLALSAAQAVELGVARWLESGADIGAAVEGRAWRRAGDLGALAMRRAVEQRERMDREAAQLRAAAPQLKAMVEEAIDFAKAQRPSPKSYEQRNGRFTAPARRAWKRDVRRALDAWDRATDTLKELHRTVTRLEKLTGEVAIPEIELRRLAERIDREVDVLRNMEKQDSR